MMMELVNEQIGAEAKVDVKVEKGVIRVEFAYDGKGGGAGLFATISTDYFLDKLAAAIPGQIDDAVIGIIKAALKA